MSETNVKDRQPKADQHQPLVAADTDADTTTHVNNFLAHPAIDY